MRSLKFTGQRKPDGSWILNLEDGSSVGGNSFDALKLAIEAYDEARAEFDAAKVPEPESDLDADLLKAPGVPPAFDPAAFDAKVAAVLDPANGPLDLETILDLAKEITTGLPPTAAQMDEHSCHAPKTDLFTIGVEDEAGSVVDKIKIEVCARHALAIVDVIEGNPRLSQLSRLTREPDETLRGLQNILDGLCDWCACSTAGLAITGMRA